MTRCSIKKALKQMEDGSTVLIRYYKGIRILLNKATKEFIVIDLNGVKTSFLVKRNALDLYGQTVKSLIVSVSGKGVKK